VKFWSAPEKIGAFLQIVFIVVEAGEIDPTSYMNISRASELVYAAGIIGRKLETVGPCNKHICLKNRRKDTILFLISCFKITAKIVTVKWNFGIMATRLLLQTRPKACEIEV